MAVISDYRVVNVVIFLNLETVAMQALPSSSNPQNIFIQIRAIN